MKFTYILITVIFAAIGLATDQQEVDFLMAFVSDFDGHRRQYVDYFMTAHSVPVEVTKIARQIVTYTDDSYTTLVEDDDINLTLLVSFATNLPWYSRIQAADISAASNLDSSQTASEGGGPKSTSVVSGAGASSLLMSGGALLGAVAVLLM